MRHRHTLSPSTHTLNRRTILRQATSSLSAVALAPLVATQSGEQSPETNFSLKHILATSLFGTEKLETILPIARQLGISAIDLWPKIHGSQREELTEMGEERFQSLLHQHNVQLGCITQFPLGPFGLQEEIKLCQRLKCHTIVTGSGGQAGLKEDDLKKGIENFFKSIQPHWDHARNHQVTIAIENHSKSLLDSPDSLRWFCEFHDQNSRGDKSGLGIAFAPYHLPQDSKLLTQLLSEVLPCTSLFYAWQHGKGCMQAQPKQDELLQLPGKGTLDFAPLLDVLRTNQYAGWTEIFMHPFPRGIPILPQLDLAAEELRNAKSHLESLIQ